MTLRIALIPLLLAVTSSATADLTISTFAGEAADRRQIDGPAAVAQFDRTKGIVSDGNGSFYLTDLRTIRKISADGSVSTAAGSGSATGPRAGTGSYVSVDAGTYLAFGGGYVFFSTGNVVQRLDVATGFVIEYVSEVAFAPAGMVVAPDATLYIADPGKHVVRRVTTSRSMTTFAGFFGFDGYADGSGSTVRFDTPLDLTIDSNGNLYVADSANRRIRKITPGGVVSTFAGGGECVRTDGNGTSACFGTVVGLTIDPEDNVYVVDNDVESTTYIRAITPAGDVTTLGQIPSPAYVNGKIAYHDGFLYLPLWNDARVVRMATPGAAITDFTGKTPPQFGLVNGPRASARFYAPSGIDADSSGNLFLSEIHNNAVRKIDAGGTVSTFATGFNHPFDVAVDSSDNVYVADTDNHVIWRITPAGSASVFAGAVGQAGYQEGTGGAARFTSPSGVFASAGTIYVADSGNHVIRRIDSFGETSLVAGFPGAAGTADGSGVDVRFNSTRDVARDASGNLFVADGFAIRRIDTLGNVTTFAGNGTQSGATDGTAGSARFTLTRGIDVDASGNLWVSDANAIRRITSGAVVTTEAGSSDSGLVNGTGALARFADAGGIVATSAGIFIADSGNHVIRQGTTAIADRATIDATQGLVGVTRHLGTTAATATSWEWSIVRRPAASSATLSATDIREPVFTPDVPDVYRFRLVASNVSGVSVSEVELHAQFATPVIASVTPHFGPIHRSTPLRIRGMNFHPDVAVTVGGNARPVTYISPEEVRVSSGGTGDLDATSHIVVLTNPDTQSASVQHWFVEGPAGGYGRADFDGDGREELFWRNVATGENALWVMDATTPSQLAQGLYLPSASTDWTPAAFADFDGDGTSDILWRNYHTGQNAIWFMSNLSLAQGVYIESATSPVNWHIAGAGDVNGDGYADIIWRNYAPGATATGVWFMNGANLIGTLALPSDPFSGTPQIVAARDFNGDGRVDLYWRGSSSPNHALWLLSASGASSASIPGPPTDYGAANDFDGDGDPDLVFRGSPNAIWYMNGASFSSGAYLPAVPEDNMRIMGSARVGNDPRAAVVWRNLFTGENALWFISGGTITGTYMPAVADSNWDLVGPR